jgi:hypothetical protein
VKPSDPSGHDSLWREEVSFRTADEQYVARRTFPAPSTTRKRAIVWSVPATKVIFQSAREPSCRGRHPDLCPVFDWRGEAINSSPRV